MDLLAVDCSLGGELSKVDAGTELGGIDVELERVQDAFVRVENIVARIAGQVRAKARETDVAIFKRYEIRDFDACEVGFAEAVADEKEAGGNDPPAPFTIAGRSRTPD